MVCRNSTNTCTEDLSPWSQTTNHSPQSWAPTFLGRCMTVTQAILLSAYTYTIQYKTSQMHSNANGLSRLPLPVPNSQTSKDSIFNVCQVQALPVSFRDIQQTTRRDKLLGKVHTYTQTGWPRQVTEELKPNSSRPNEIGIEAECLMWGIRVIVLDKLRPRVLKSLHKNHPGITRMKAIPTSYF